jgi:hypothetical protein
MEVLFHKLVLGSTGLVQFQLPTRTELGNWRLLMIVDDFLSPLSSSFWALYYSPRRRLATVSFVGVGGDV